MSEIELHRKLLGDALRNRALHDALKQTIRPGVSTLVDVGAGTGFLSFLARRLGAVHATLIEYTNAIGLAEQLARKNRLTGLTFIKSHSSEVRKLGDLGKADIVVSETLGNYALEENLLETLVDARRFLKPGGVLIPARLKQYVAPVLGSRLQDALDVWPGVGYDIDLTSARTLCLNNMYVRSITPEDLGANAQMARVWDEIDFNPTLPAPSSRRGGALRWQVDAQLTVHGFALWWECELIAGISLSTSPYAPPTHWEQVYLPLLKPCELVAGDTLDVTLTSDTRPEVGVRVGWRTRQLRGEQVLTEQTQDTLRGRL